MPFREPRKVVCSSSNLQENIYSKTSMNEDKGRTECNCCNMEICHLFLVAAKSTTLVGVQIIFAVNLLIMIKKRLAK